MTTPRILESHCEWTADDFTDESSFTETLTETELAELDYALRHATAKSTDPLALTVEDYPLPTLHERLVDIQRALIDGRGFVRLRGIDRSRYRQSEMELLYWGIGMHLGLPWAQNKHGHVLGDVTDQGKAPDDPEARGNEFGAIALPFHCDGADLVGLMCLANGRSGGRSLVASSVRIHNQLVRDAPELAAALYEPFPYDFRGEQPDGAPGFYALPVFTEWDDRLFVRCIPGYIWASQRHPEAPRLSDTQIEALRAVERLANDPTNHVAMELAPGDIQFIDNFHVMHGRTAYTDDPSANRVRHLKRLWLETTALSSRPPYFTNHNRYWERNRSTSRIRVDAEG